MSVCNATETTPQRSGLKTLTRDEVAQLGAITDVHAICGLLGVSECYARLLCATGKIKAVKLGKAWRVNTSSLLEYAGLI